MPGLFSNFDFRGLQALNIVIQLLSSDPGSPAEGQLWYNTTSHQLRYHNGSAVITLYQAVSTATASTAMLRDGSGNVAINVLTAQGVTLPNAPSAGTDAVNLTYLQSVLNGLQPKGEVRAATTAALPANTYANGTLGVGATLTANSNGALPAQDGVTLSAGDRLAAMGEVAPANNGVYVVTAVGDGSHPYVLTRDVDFDQTAEVKGAFFLAGTEGTVNSGKGFIAVGNGPWTIGTTSITFAPFFTVTRASLGAAGVYSTTITGDGSTTVFTVTHNLNSQIVDVAVRDSSHNAIVVDTNANGVNTVQVTFAVAPAISVTYGVMVTG